jgi:hypothetical protein
LCSVGLLDVLYEYACAGVGRDALSGRRLRRLATKPAEKCGPNALQRDGFGKPEKGGTYISSKATVADCEAPRIIAIRI